MALYAPDEASLHDLSARLTYENIPHKLICEPDAPYFNQAVAIGICPQPRARLRKLLGKYLLIRNPEEENNGNV